MELLLVVLIIGIAAAAVVPNFGRSTGRLELKKAAEDLAAAIRYGQMRAMSRGRYLRLNTDAAGYWLEEDRSSSEEKRPAEAARDFIRLQDRWGRRSDFPAGITLSPVGNEVMINPDGRMSALDLRLCRAQCCLIVTTGRQRGRVEIEGEESDERGALP